jgi:integrase
MSVKEDPSNPGKWIAFYSKRHPITRQPIGLRRVGIETKAMAKRIEAQLILQVDAKIRRNIIPIWSKVVSGFIHSRQLEGMSGKAIETYRLCLEAHTFPSWGTKLVDEINCSEIRELILSRLGHKSPSHQKNLLKFIRGAFTYALEKGYVQANPCPQMKFRIGDKIKSVLTLEQVKAFLTQAKIMESEWYPIWAMALYTGMRNGELYAATWDKVNLEQRRILVDSAWNKEDGFKDTKSGDDRIVEIAPELLVILRDLKIRNTDSSFVLPRIDKWDRGEQARELRMFLQGLGLPRIRFHDLRATWATIMLSMAIAPIKVMAMGGWKDLKTMQFYIRKSGVDTSGMVNALSLHNPYSEFSALSII